MGSINRQMLRWEHLYKRAEYKTIPKNKSSHLSPLQNISITFIIFFNSPSESANWEITSIHLYFSQRKQIRKVIQDHQDRSRIRSSWKSSEFIEWMFVIHLLNGGGEYKRCSQAKLFSTHSLCVC